jgi:DNA-binding response OmpR family regulator
MNDRTDQRKPSILVVDDTPENLRLLSNLFREHDYEVRPVPSGKLALQAVEMDPPDLILLDINMPGMNGFEVCDALKQNEAWMDIPVIFVSALDEVFDKVRAFSVGGVDYITKPFQVEEVLARVRTHMALRRTQLQLSGTIARLRELEAMRESLFQMVVHDLKSNPPRGGAPAGTRAESRRRPRAHGQRAARCRQDREQPHADPATGVGTARAGGPSRGQRIGGRPAAAHHGGRP